MKTVLWTGFLCSLLLGVEIELTPQEERDWQIETAKAKEVAYVPLESSMMEVKIPPTLLHTLSLAYEVQVKELYKTNFESVERGEAVALLTSPHWIEAQKEAIAAWIEFSSAQNEAKRKAKLCKEEIIAQKECITADTELDIKRVKFLTSKALLASWGATEEMTQKLFDMSKIIPDITLHSTTKGVIVATDIEVGKTIAPSNALFVIKKGGENWLEGEIAQSVAALLLPNQNVVVKSDKEELQAKVLLLSATINSSNQTRYVRLSLAKNSKLLAGERIKAELNIAKRAFVIAKKAVVQRQNENIVFIKKGQIYHPLKVTLLAQNRDVCYLEYQDALKESVAISATSILQNRLQEGE